MANKDLNTQSPGMGGTSYMYRFGTSPESRTAVSQKVRILTPHYGDEIKSQSGVISNVTISETRTVEEVRGIGFGDMIAELVPGVTSATTLDFERTMLYLSNLWQSTGYAGGVSGAVRSLRHHRWPFDVEQQLVFSTIADKDMEDSAFVSEKDIKYPNYDTDLHKAVITIYESCWFTSYGTTYSKDNAILMETGNAICTDVHDLNSTYGEFLRSGNDPTVGNLGSIRFSDIQV